MQAQIYAIRCCTRRGGVGGLGVVVVEQRCQPPGRHAARTTISSLCWWCAGIFGRTYQTDSRVSVFRGVAVMDRRWRYERDDKSIGYTLVDAILYSVYIYALWLVYILCSARSLIMSEKHFLYYNIIFPARGNSLQTLSSPKSCAVKNCCARSMVDLLVGCVDRVFESLEDAVWRDRVYGQRNTHRKPMGFKQTYKRNFTLKLMYIWGILCQLDGIKTSMSQNSSDRII